MNTVVPLVTLVPPVVVTFTFRIPAATPAGTTAFITPSPITVTPVSAVLAVSSRFTLLTAELDVPPKKFAPFIVMAVIVRFVPLNGLTLETVGAGIGTTVKTAVAVSLFESPPFTAYADIVEVDVFVNGTE